MGALIIGAVTSAFKDELSTKHYSPVEGYWELCPLAQEIDEIAAGSYTRKNPPEIAGTRYVVRSLEAGGATPSETGACSQ